MTENISVNQKECSNDLIRKENNRTIKQIGINRQREEKKKKIMKKFECTE